MAGSSRDNYSETSEGDTASSPSSTLDDRNAAIAVGLNFIDDIWYKVANISNKYINAREFKGVLAQDHKLKHSKSFLDRYLSGEEWIVHSVSISDYTYEISKSALANWFKNEIQDLKNQYAEKIKANPDAYDNKILNDFTAEVLQKCNEATEILQALTEKQESILKKTVAKSSLFDDFELIKIDIQREAVQLGKDYDNRIKAVIAAAPIPEAPLANKGILRVSDTSPALDQDRFASIIRIADKLKWTSAKYLEKRKAPKTPVAAETLKDFKEKLKNDFGSREGFHDYHAKWGDYLGGPPENIATNLNYNLLVTFRNEIDVLTNQCRLTDEHVIEDYSARVIQKCHEALAIHAILIKMFGRDFLPGEYFKDMEKNTQKELMAFKKKDEKRIKSENTEAKQVPELHSSIKMKEAEQKTQQSSDLATHASEDLSTTMPQPQRNKGHDKSIDTVASASFIEQVERIEGQPSGAASAVSNKVVNRKEDEAEVSEDEPGAALAEVSDEALEPGAESQQSVLDRLAKLGEVTRSGQVGPLSRSNITSISSAPIFFAENKTAIIEKAKPVADSEASNVHEAGVKASKKYKGVKVKKAQSEPEHENGVVLEGHPVIKNNRPGGK